MKNNEILYKIKTLEKLVLRNLIANDLEKGILPKKIPTPTQMQIIKYILEHDNNDIYQRDLEKILNLKRATVSGVLQTMEKNELIKRKIDIKDTRSKKIILNEKTKNIFLENERRFNEIEEIIIKDVSTEDLNIFSKVIDTMIKNIKSKNNIQEVNFIERDYYD